MRMMIIILIAVTVATWFTGCDSAPYVEQRVARPPDAPAAPITTPQGDAMHVNPVPPDAR